MNPAYTLTSCTNCQGTGRAGALTCTTCGGDGQWLQTPEGIKLVLPLPDLLKPEPANLAGYYAAGWYGIAAVSTVGLLWSGAAIVSQQGPSLASFLWQRGINQTFFGISGLMGALSLYHFNTRSLPMRELRLLPQDLTGVTAGSRLPLAPYCHPRLSSLIKDAVRTADSLHTPVINESVLLITLLSQPRIRSIVNRLEYPTDPIIDLIKQQLPAREPTHVTAVTLDPAARSRFYQAFQIAQREDFLGLDIEHVLLAILEQPGQYADLFNSFDFKAKNLLSIARWYDADSVRQNQWSVLTSKGKSRKKGYMNRAWTALPTPYLDAYGQDLTRLAANGGSPSLSSREDEVKRVLEVLGRTRKNNLLLVGEPGVGKKSLLQGIAARIIEGEVPATLFDKRLVSMDLAALIGDASTPEGNIQQIIDEVIRAGNVILSIPDVRALIGTSGNSLDAASLLSNALNNGQLQIVATATYAEYHRYLESNPTLSAQLELVEVKEPSVEQAIAILEEDAPHLESRQGVMLTYPALEAAAHLAKEYLADKVLPTSAIGLLDEAASSALQDGKGLVTKEIVEQTVEKKTNIPIRQAAAEEADRLLNLEDELHKRVVGQEAAITAVAAAVRRARAGLRDKRRPISSLLFIGPTGVGKTETAKALAALYYGSEAAMLRLDMSEYQDARSIYRLIGAPASSSDETTQGGSLTQPIREHPYSLVLLDEIEKAHPDVLNLFLQLLEDGRLTENSGRTVSFTNAIIIATSNAGSSEILQLLQQGIAADQLTTQTTQLLTRFFKPELINRFDAVVPFKQLTQEQINQIVQMMLAELTTRVSSQGYTLEVTPDAVIKIGQLGYDPAYGARPLRRFIQDHVESKLADLILRQSVQTGGTLRITAEMIQ